MWTPALLVLVALPFAATPFTATPFTATPPPERADDEVTTIRIATFNVRELSREKLDRLTPEGTGADLQLRRAAEILQRARPDVVLLNEIDFDPAARENARLFVERYLGVCREGLEPLVYPHVVFEPVNTGVPSGMDLDRDGRTDGPEDAWGFGRYPGQYGMALLSLFPVGDPIRTFRTLRWAAMPGNLLPDGGEGRPAWYPAEVAERLRLSSKSHWDVPLRIGDATLHVLASHPTPPVFDGEEDRNGRRNFDEIRLWADYLSGGRAASYLVDDAGVVGGLEDDAHFVLLGDLNADPWTDAGPYGRTAISQLLDHPRVGDPRPAGEGGRHVERPDGTTYSGPREHQTSAWGRLDYVLPDRDLEVVGSGVWWPGPDDPLRHLVDGGDSSSDHRLVWIDVVWPPD